MSSQEKLEKIIDVYLDSVADVVLSNTVEANPALVKARATEALANDVFTERDDNPSWMPLTVNMNGLSISPSSCSSSLQFQEK
jgi:hypothetical protein